MDLVERHFREGIYHPGPDHPPLPLAVAQSRRDRASSSCAP